MVPGADSLQGITVLIDTGRIVGLKPAAQAKIPTVIFDGFGEEVGRYRKIHPFDITTPSGRRYGESETVMPGSNLLVYSHRGLRIGCAICYDLRFSNPFWERARREEGI